VTAGSKGRGRWDLGFLGGNGGDWVGISHNGGYEQKKERQPGAASSRQPLFPLRIGKDVGKIGRRRPPSLGGGKKNPEGCGPVEN